jgi:uncharacterized protein
MRPLLRSALLFLTLTAAIAAPTSNAAKESPTAPSSEIVALRGKAEAGEATAQLQLADLILSGRAKGSENSEAVALLNKAADSGHAPAQLALARLLYSGGSGIPVDIERAQFLTQQAAEAGLAQAQSAFGDQLYQQIDPKAREINYAAPLEWFRKAAAQNDPQGLCRLGMMTTAGEGLAPDPTAGWKLIRQAAHTGHPLALNEAGTALQLGLGVAQDEIAAIGYFHAAADLGNPTAMFNLAAAYETGRGIPPSNAHAGAAYARAAKLGFPLAQLAIGRFFEEGIGTEKQPVLAYINYDRAAATLPEAATRRDALKKTLSKTQLAEALKLPGRKANSSQR